jgi:hypothetical protein
MSIAVTVTVTLLTEIQPRTDVDSFPGLDMRLNDVHQCSNNVINIWLVAFQ